MQSLSWSRLLRFAHHYTCLWQSQNFLYQLLSTRHCTLKNLRWQSAATLQQLIPHYLAKKKTSLQPKLRFLSTEVFVSFPSAIVTYRVCYHMLSYKFVYFSHFPRLQWPNISVGFLSASGTLFTACQQHLATYKCQRKYNCQSVYVFPSLHNIVKYCLTFFMYGFLQRPDGNTAHICGAKNVLLSKFTF